MKVEERSSWRKILTVSMQLKQLQKESLKKIQAWTGWIFFRLSFHNCLNCVLTTRIFLLLDLSSAVQKLYVSYIHNHLFSLHGYIIIYELTIWPAPSWLDSSVGRALHQYCRGHGFKSRSSLNVFRLSFCNCLSCILTVRIFLLLDCIV